MKIYWPIGLTREMPGRTNRSDLFDQTRILPREALLDLLEDPLFVLAEGHRFLTWPWGEVVASDYRSRAEQRRP